MEDVQKFIPNIFSSLRIDGLVHGTLEQGQVANMFDYILKVLQPRPLMPSQFIGGRCVLLPTGSKFVSAYPVSIPPSTTIFKSAIPGIYLFLRTREQLGYLVFSDVHPILSQMAFQLTIQSERDPIYLEDRILEFLESLREIIKEMTAEKLEKHKNLLEEGTKFYDKFIMPSSAEGSTISVHLQSQKPPPTLEKEVNFTVDQLYPTLVYLDLINKEQESEEDFKSRVNDKSIQTEAGLTAFLKDSIKLSQADIDLVVLKLNQDPSGLSRRDHTKLPKNCTAIQDLVATTVQRLPALFSRLALQMLMCTRSPTPNNLFISDEIQQIATLK
ncbi:hypothetical protein [Parasitella parasitica]|uniref:Coenzyme PQQ synthesis protein F-like C-terminal lobe domain-containing protein n=1 Tax=Parasitella parasitica TaxID=35722 RepID=A0A0B7NHZ5_9FUNG|nr:hypothetical protein [Parasitella parasitica]